LNTDSKTLVTMSKDSSCAQVVATKLDSLTFDESNIVKKDVTLPGGEKQKDKLAFVLYNVLTPKECTDLIEKTEKKGYELALVNVGFGKQKVMTDVRNSSRCIIDWEDYAEELYKRTQRYIPKLFVGRKCLGLNERLRFLRYDKGEYFKPHCDGSYRRENGETSCLTFQLYLNEGFKGGATNFLSWEAVPETVPVVPKTGSVLIFQHDILHEGEALQKGRKYAMRTDIMYSAERYNPDGSRIEKR